MNKAQLIQALSEHYNGSKAEAAKALGAVVQTITYQTAAGEKVSISGFGVFEKISRGERMVRNPRTGERKLAAPTAVPRFRAGTDLKAYVSGARALPPTPGGPVAAILENAAPEGAAELSTAPTVVAPPPVQTNGKKSGGKKSGGKKAGGKKTVITTSSSKGAGRKAAARS